MVKLTVLLIGMLLVTTAISGCAMKTEASALTVYAASCSQQDVQAAIDQAQEGETIVVPEGQCTWTTSSGNAPAVLISNKSSITLQGAGIDKTVIVDETGDAYLQHLIYLVDTMGVRITGFTFEGMKKDPSMAEPAIKIENSNTDWRVDHCKFDSSDRESGKQGRGMMAGGRGVVDHSIFLNTMQGVAVMGDGDASWERPRNLGSEDAVYIEDCYFETDEEHVTDGALDAYNGARYVFRYNTMVNTTVGHHGFDSGSYRSPHSFEIYENSMTMVKTNTWYVSHYRGGSGVVFNNTLIGNYNENQTIGVVNYRTCCEVSHSNCSDWGRCDAVEDYFCSATWQRCTIDSDCPSGETCTRILDGHLDETGYPCRDQVGRTTDQDGDGIQDQAPIYEWGNTVNGNDADISVIDPWGCTNPSMYDHIQEGREFFNDTALPEYTPFTYPHPLTLASLRGDLNQDGSVNILDLQLCVNVSIGAETRLEVVSRADLNADGMVNFDDVQEIVNILLGG